MNGQDVKPEVSTSTATENKMNMKPTKDLTKNDVVLNEANTATGILLGFNHVGLLQMMQYALYVSYKTDCGHNLFKMI